MVSNTLRILKSSLYLTAIFLSLVFFNSIMGEEKMKIIFDTDLAGDIDDAFAHALVQISPEFEVLGSRIVLCDFCMVDFSSYDAELLGLPKGTAIRLGSPEFKELGPVEHAGPSKDKVCPACNRRLKFLNWILEVREGRSGSRSVR